MSEPSPPSSPAQPTSSAQDPGRTPLARPLVPEIGAVFAVPFVQIELPGHAELDIRLRAKFLAWEKTPHAEARNRPSPVGKYNLHESDFDLFERPDPDVRFLARFALTALGHVVQRLNGYDPEEMALLRFYTHSWFHITRPGGYMNAHNHPMASWSGVYCVSDGEPEGDDPANGRMRFFDPRGQVTMYLDPGNSHLLPPYGTGTFVHTHRPGVLTLFPSYLYHDVAPFHGRSERITVAFNAWVRYADQPNVEPGLRPRPLRPRRP